MQSRSHDNLSPLSGRIPGLVCRIWRGWTTRENAPAYAAYLNDELFPRLAAELTPNGYRGHQLLRRELERECEFVTLTWFASLDAVTSFAGADYTRANVSAKARSLLLRFDEHATQLHARHRAAPRRCGLAIAETVPMSSAYFHSIPRTIYGPEHESFRAGLQRFIREHVAPGLDRWEQQGHVDRALWQQAGSAGYLCMTLPKQYGGAGRDFRFNAIFREELARVGVSGTALGMGLHSDVVAPFLWRNGTSAQREHWLPPMCRGDAIGALAMTETDAGSDLKAIATRAERIGDEYVINGAKTFITNGWQADVVILVVKTDPAAGARGISLVMVETGRAGFRRGDPMKKLSLRAEDTCELFLDNVHVPLANLLGREGEGFAMLMAELPWERLQVALSAQAAAEAAMEWTLAYTGERRVFGQPLKDYQNTRFRLAECATELQLGRLMIDRCVELAVQGCLDNTSAAMAKLYCTELQGRVVDACLQMHGGNGVMWRTPITRAYADARVQRIYAGTNEIMKEIIARRLWERV